MPAAGADAAERARDGYKARAEAAETKLGAMGREVAALRERLEQAQQFLSGKVET